MIDARLIAEFDRAILRYEASWRRACLLKPEADIECAVMEKNPRGYVERLAAINDEGPWTANEAIEAEWSAFSEAGSDAVAAILAIHGHHLSDREPGAHVKGPLPSCMVIRGEFLFAAIHMTDDQPIDPNHDLDGTTSPTLELKIVRLANLINLDLAI